MSFKDGFAAIDQIQISGKKLSESVARIESLEKSLEGLRTAQDQVEAAIDKTTSVIAAIQTASEGLIQQHILFEKLAKELPVETESVLAQAEKRIKEQQSAIASLIADIPLAIELVVERKMTALMSQLESRISERMHGELKETRMALRDAMEVNSRSQEVKLESAIKEIIAEMPRGLLGRRGRV